MDRSLEARHWRRGFAAGVAALALAVSGQLATGASVAGEQSCPLASQPGIAEQVFDQIAPRIRAHGLAHRVALALLGAMLHESCS